MEECDEWLGMLRKYAEEEGSILRRMRGSLLFFVCFLLFEHSYTLHSVTCALPVSDSFSALSHFIFCFLTAIHYCACLYGANKRLLPSHHQRLEQLWVPLVVEKEPLLRLEDSFF